MGQTRPGIEIDFLFWRFDVPFKRAPKMKTYSEFAATLTPEQHAKADKLFQDAMK
jgi:hypothetical protein